MNSNIGIAYIGIATTSRADRVLKEDALLGPRPISC